MLTMLKANMTRYPFNRQEHRSCSPAAHRALSVFCLLLACTLGGWADDAAAAITRVGVTAGVNVKTSDRTLTVTAPPAGVINDDQMLLVLSMSGVSLTAVTPPIGWTQVNLTSGAAHSQAIFRKTAFAETGPYVFNWTYTGTPGGNDRALAYIIAYRGVDLTAPINASGGQYNSTSSTSVQAPTINTTVANTVLVGFFGLSNNVGGGTLPASMANAYSQTTGGGAGGSTVLSGDQAFVGSGATGTRTATFGSAAVSVGHLLALRESASLLNHIRIEHDGAGLTCTPETVTVKACADAACTTLYTSSSTTVTLSGAGWSTNPITFTGSTTASLSVTTPSTFTLGTTAVAPTPSATSPVCVNSGGGVACNIIFADTGFIFSTVPTQTAGVTSGAVTIQAVKKSDNSAACTGVFSGNVTIDMASQCVDPTTCAGKQLTINTTAIANNPASAISSYTAVVLNFGANSTASFTLNYPDVGTMSLSARYALGGGNFMTGTSNAFVVKPFGFSISGIQRTADGFANPAAASAAGTAFIKAGDSFTATITAIANGGLATPNYGRETAPEGVLLTQAIVLPAAGNNLALSNGSIAGGAFSSGVATPTNLSWGEVGIITMTPSVGDGSYLGAGDTTGTTTGNIGRFTPHHFVASGTLTTRAGLSCAPASAFTYMGEPMRLALALTAQNATNSTTQNYTTASGFAKLDGATAAKWTSFGSADSIGLGAVDGTNALSSRLAISGTPTGSWVAGVGTLTADVVLNRTTSPDGPFSALRLGIAPQDADTISLLSGALNLDANLDSINERAQAPAAATAVRYGRVRLNNAHGSELLALPVPVRAQYFSSSGSRTGFITNTDDNCTAFTLAPTVNNIPITYQYGDLLLANPQPSGMLASVTTTAPTFASPLSAGASSIVFAKPNPVLSGSVDLTLTVPVWLQYNWTGLSGNPTARVTFGTYRKNDQFIYQRENY